MSLSVQYPYHFNISNESLIMNPLKTLTVFLLIAVSFLASCAPKPDIEIEDPWLRLMPEGVSSTAGFMSIKNNTGEPIVLEDVSLDWANHAMMHESKVVDGMAKMEHLDELVIDNELVFQPGAKHIMIMGVKEPLVEGKSYNIRLHFKDREPIEVAFKVRQAK